MPKQKIPLCKNRNKGHFVCILFTGNNEIFSDFCKEKYKETIMTVSDFLEYVKKHPLLSTEEIQLFMNEMSDEARRITFEINTSYHTQDELRALFSKLLGKEVDPTFRVFPPFYTDFGKNITIGKHVFINACCHFQDHGGVTIGNGCLIGHNVVFATLNHDLNPKNRAAMIAAPIVLGENVWIGSNSTILQGVTIGDGAVIGAGSVVTKDVDANTIVAGVPARYIRDVDSKEDIVAN